jgi:hypothetical protein
MQRSQAAYRASPSLALCRGRQASVGAAAALPDWTKGTRGAGASGSLLLFTEASVSAHVALSPSGRLTKEGTRRWLAAPFQRERKPSVADVKGVVPSSQRQIGPRMDQADTLGSSASPCLRRHLGEQPSTATGIRSS